MDTIIYKDIDLDELDYVLRSIFKSSAHLDKESIIYPSSSGNYAVKVSKKGEISLISGPACNNKIIAKMKEKIISDIRNSKKQIGRSILFSDLPLYGYFRYKDLFQILHVPDHTPRPEFAGIGLHPILLEYVYDKSTNGFINAYRQNKKSYEISWIMNMFLNSYIRRSESRIRHQWVRCGDDTSSKLCYTEYRFDNFSIESEEFSDTKELVTLKQVDPKEYYNYGQNISEGLKVPTIIQHLLDKVFSLDSKSLFKFLDICKLFALSNKLWETSQTMAYLAAINTIEAIPKPKSKTEMCKCGRPLNGPTKEFREFLKKYAPSSKITDKIRKELYNLRSDMTHKGKLFESDAYPYSHILFPKRI
ncbi:MAG: hypothetical protein AB1480_17125 [Nitrospirota bacterium]